MTEALKMTKVCPVCGRTLPVSEFRYYTKDRLNIGRKCNECRRREKNEKNRARTGCKPFTTIWTPEIIETLIRLYATSTNKDLAEKLGIPARRIAEKASTIGLKKDHAVLSEMARVTNEKKRAKKQQQIVAV